MPRILVACEFSGTVRSAFEKKGWDAWSCDLLPSEKEGNHYQCDVAEVIDLHWDVIIGHPPCTYLTNSGVCYIDREGRYEGMLKGTDFFNSILLCKCKHVAVENPIMSGYALSRVGKPSQIIQPYMFGHPEQKATCLWLKGLPYLKGTRNVAAKMLRLPKSKQQRLHYLSPGKDRWKERSRTFQGIAEAMASQWGEYVEKRLERKSYGTS